MKIDFTARKVFIDDKEVEMSPKEYVLLFYLVRNEGIALTREQLIHDVWGYDFYGDDRTLDTHIKLLRKSLQDYSRLIITLRGVGYRFEAENKQVAGVDRKERKPISVKWKIFVTLVFFIVIIIAVLWFFRYFFWKNFICLSNPIP